MAEVSGAITSLARFRLQQFADRLEERVGDVKVFQPRNDGVVDYEVSSVAVKMDERLKNIEAETGRQEKLLQELIEKHPDLLKKQ